MYSNYKIVKDNAGRTGRNRRKFKYYDIMHEIFCDTEGSVAVSPNFIDGAENRDIEPEIPRRERTSHDEPSMRELVQAYHEESLALQWQAVALEERKVNLLERIFFNLQ